MSKTAVEPCICTELSRPMTRQLVGFCLDMCCAVNHSCICKDLGFENISQCLATDNHECFCNDGPKAQCRAEHPCTCIALYRRPWLCRATKRHSCICDISSPFLCLGHESNMSSVGCICRHTGSLVCMYIFHNSRNFHKCGCDDRHYGIGYSHNSTCFNKSETYRKLERRYKLVISLSIYDYLPTYTSRLRNFYGNN